MNKTHTESNIRKVALTSLSGTSIEWYDFFLYGAAAGLVFPKLFFGEVDPTTALILSFSCMFHCPTCWWNYIWSLWRSNWQKEDFGYCSNVNGYRLDPYRLITYL